MKKSKLTERDRANILEGKIDYIIELLEEDKIDTIPHKALFDVQEESKILAPDWYSIFLIAKVEIVKQLAQAKVDYMDKMRYITLMNIKN